MFYEPYKPFIPMKTSKLERRDVLYLAFMNTPEYKSMHKSDAVYYLNKVVNDDYMVKRILSYLTELELSENIKSIDDYACHYCSNLLRIKINDGVKSIGVRAFCHCSSLQHLVIPDSVIKIDISAFEYCTNLKTIQLSKNLSTVKISAFEYCSNLEELYLPSSITMLDSSSFSRCKSLYHLSIETYIDSLYCIKRNIDCCNESTYNYILKDINEWFNYVFFNSTNIQSLSISTKQFKINSFCTVPKAIALSMLIDILIETNEWDYIFITLIKLVLFIKDIYYFELFMINRRDLFTEKLMQELIQCAIDNKLYEKQIYLIDLKNKLYHTTIEETIKKKFSFDDDETNLF